MERDFRYYDGNVVQVGDQVRTGGGHLGIVDEIILPETPEAESYSCPRGGVLITQDWNGIKSPLLLEPPDGEYWEDIELVNRRNPSNLTGS